MLASDVVPDAIPPPPGFPPFSWPIASERFGSSLCDGALPDVLVSNPDVEPQSSPIAQDQVSASADSPDDVLVGTDSVPDAIRPVAPSPPIEQIFRAGLAVGAGCCSVASHRRSSRDPSTLVAASPGGPVWTAGASSAVP